MIDGDATAARVSFGGVPRDAGERAGVGLWDNRWFQVVVLFLLFITTGRLGHLLAIPPGLATPVWLPSGITLAAIVVFGSRLWPGVFLGAVLVSVAQVGDAASIATIAATSAIAALIAVAVTSEPLLAVYLLNRLGVQGGFLSRAHNVSMLLLVVAPISCAFAATAATLVLAATGLIDWKGFGETWATWIIGDLAGIYLIAPFLLTWAEGERPKLGPRDRRTAVFSVGCLGVACVIAFVDIPPFLALASLDFLPIPPLVFIAYRFDDRFASLVGPAVAAVAIIAAANGLGPFGSDPSNQNILALQLYTLVGVLTALFTRSLANERDAAEQAARRLSSDLAHASRVATMGEIAAGMAHEYHQPLAAIANYASASLYKLKRHSTAYEEVREPLERITDETQRAAMIVRRLTDFLQRREPQRALCDPNEIVGDAVQLTRMAHSFPRVLIRHVPTPGLPVVEVDRVQITQVLVNLLVNACEAMESSGGGEGAVEIGVRLVKEGTIRIEVEDDGPGMDEAVAQHCFDQFYSTKEHGLGVGLGISRTLAEAHGGRLYRKLSDRRGTTFCLELPLPG